MALRINGVTGTYSVPRVLKRYRFVAFTPTLTVSDTSDAGTEEKSVDVKIKLEQAWRFVTNGAARAKVVQCLFQEPVRGKTLKDVLDEAHHPAPAGAEGRIYLGDFAGCEYRRSRHRHLRRIAFQPRSQRIGLHAGSRVVHVAGATSEQRIGKDALAAELSLKSCLCTKYFRDTSLGKNDSFKVVKPDTRYA